MFIVFGAVGQVIAGTTMFVLSLFLILLVLVQRGRGGGLAGAFGGMGGQSAFGAKAGDTFTRITIVTAAIWILICLLSVRFLGGQSGTSSAFADDGTQTSETTDGTNEDLDSILGGDESGESGESGSGDASESGDAAAEVSTDADVTGDTPSDDDGGSSGGDEADN